MCYTGYDALSYQAQTIVRSLAHKLDTLIIVGNPFAYKAVEEYVPQVVFAYDSNHVVIDRVLSGELYPEGILPVNLEL